MGYPLLLLGSQDGGGAPPYTPATPPVPGALALYDAAYAPGVQLSGSDVVGMADLSGNGRHATAPAGHTLHPAYDSGAGELVWNASLGVMGLKIPVAGQAQITFVVTATRGTQTSTSTTSNRPVLTSVALAGSVLIGTLRSGVASNDVLIGQAWSGSEATAAWGVGNKVAFVVLADATANSIRVVGSNGQDVTQAAAGLNATNLASVTEWLLGYEPTVAARVFTGRIARVALYPGILSAGDITAALAWGVQ